MNSLMQLVARPNVYAQKGTSHGLTPKWKKKITLLMFLIFMCRTWSAPNFQLCKSASDFGKSTDLHIILSNIGLKNFHIDAVIFTIYFRKTSVSNHCTGAISRWQYLDSCRKRKAQCTRVPPCGVWTVVLC